jgi:site-specific DNA-methyltransferase (adenine-specific)
MWNELKRIIKPNGAIVLFASQPFTSILITSNIKMFKYSWVWDKVRGSNFFAAKFQPLNNSEDIVVFSTGGCNNGTSNPVPYYPQGIKSCEKGNKYGGGKVGKAHGAIEKEYIQKTTGYPFKIIKFSYEKSTMHPTQKPVALMEYLIKTYTNEDEVVLDFTAGSMSTAIACINTNRKGIMIEKDEYYFKVGSDRVSKALQER